MLRAAEDKPLRIAVIGVGIAVALGLYLLCELIQGRTLDADLELYAARGQPYPRPRLRAVRGALSRSTRLAVAGRSR